MANGIECLSNKERVRVIAFENQHGELSPEDVAYILSIDEETYEKLLSQEEET